MDDDIFNSLRYALTMLNRQQGSAPTFNVPIIPPLTVPVAVTTLNLSVGAAIVDTTLGANFVAVNWEEEIIPPKVSHAFLVMISE